MPKRKDKPLYQPKLTGVDEATLHGMRQVYRTIRKTVYNESTRPPTNDPATHARNKITFRNKVLSICDTADLKRFSLADTDSRRALWHHLWSKIRYSGISAPRATQEINSIAPLFDQYEWFCTGDWTIPKGRFKSEVIDGEKVYEDAFYNQCGADSRDYMRKRGPFADKYIIRNRAKLNKTVAVARQFKTFFELFPDSPAIDFVGNRISPASKYIWATHRALMRQRKYTQAITALHLMMDLGYAVIKPDRVVVRSFYQLGWLEKVIAFPPGTTEVDIIGTNSRSQSSHQHTEASDPDAEYDEDVDDSDDAEDAAPNSHALYTHEKIYKPTVELSRAIVSGLSRKELESDIGWAADNLLREFDLFVVKYGQDPEPAFGIERNLHSRTPFSSFR